MLSLSIIVIVSLFMYNSFCDGHQQEQFLPTVNESMRSMLHSSIALTPIVSFSFFRVISDPNLAMPVRLGVVGKWGAGKSKIMKGILWCLKQACDTTCSHLCKFSKLFVKSNGPGALFPDQVAVGREKKLGFRLFHSYKNYIWAVSNDDDPNPGDTRNSDHIYHR